MLTRRRFLSLLGLGATAAGVELVAPEPVRRWFVARNAPVGLPPMLHGWTGADGSWNVAEEPPKVCCCASPYCNLMHGCRECGAVGLCGCGLKAMREQLEAIKASPRMRDWVGPAKQETGSEYITRRAVESLREPVTELDREWPRMREPSAAEIADMVAALRQSYLGPSTPEADWHVAEPYDIGFPNKPIGTVESIDPETGIATVRLHKPLTGYRARITV